MTNSRSDRFPDSTLEERCRAAGAEVRCCWQMKGPKDTAIAWMECLQIGSGIVIVQTYKGGGWEAYSALPVNEIEATVADVLARCRVKPDTVRDAAPELLAATRSLLAIVDRQPWGSRWPGRPHAQADAAQAAIAKAEGR